MKWTSRSKLSKHVFTGVINPLLLQFDNIRPYLEIINADFQENNV